MLFGSLSGFPGAGLLVRSTRAIGLVSTAAGAGGLAARSSTLTGGCCSGVVAQPAATAAAARMAMITRRMASFLSFYEWSPGRLTHVPCRDAETLLDPAVRRHRRQHAAS